MKTLYISILILLFFFGKTFSQACNGVIVSQNDQLSIIKIWGNHEERGYAYGFLLGDKISDIYDNYIKSQFGSYLPLARQIIQDQEHILIDSIYIIEAKAVIQGMDSANNNSYSMDYVDLLVANSFLDIQGLGAEFSNLNLSNGCSSLISWGDATSNTVLNGKAVITRHLDWSPNTYVIRNQAIVIHFPSETDEQAWIMMGFCGQISALSAVNVSGVSVFQHMLSDYNGQGQMYQHYLPIWFALRKAIETVDYNDDGVHNTEDVRQLLNDNSQGFAEGYIVATAAVNSNYDSLTALIAELAPTAPTHTFRTNSFADSIPGDNLYAANYEIKRNLHYHFCSRYNNMRNNIGDGMLISDSANWALMKNFSNQGSSNIQMMQVFPESNILKFAYHNSDSGAYLREPTVFDLTELFTSPVSAPVIPNLFMNEITVYPNPFDNRTTLSVYSKEMQNISISVLDINGRILQSDLLYSMVKGLNRIELSMDELSSGIYFLRITLKNSVLFEKIIVR